jgi:short-subunit dehydrogenase involved in D-alanine esterification of teichoic acids
MAKYVLTGGATGIGAAIKAALLADQNEVITLDIRDGDYDVDLGDAEARAQVIAQVKADHPTLDGIITCAGVASHFQTLGKFLASIIGARLILF